MGIAAAFGQHHGSNPAFGNIVALRGLGDTHTAMLAHLVGYWVVGLPVAYVLCFPMGWGAAGIWVGLSAALILIGLILVPAWHRRSSRAVEYIQR